MFKANGRAGKSTARETAASSLKTKEFVCSACKTRKLVGHVEFGEQILCDCGGDMYESYEE